LTFFLSKLGAIVLRYSSKDLMSPVLALYDDLIKVLLTKFMTKLYDNLKFSYNNESNQNLNKPESCTNK
jgi:hypothetical protein